MKVHVLQHVRFEGLGSIEPWLVERGADIRYTRFFAGDPLPDLGAVDFLVVMGGPMSVNDEAEFPWLKLEKQTIREAVARDIRVLGVCLGAQLIASAFKSRVYPNPAKEIGWFPIEGLSEGEGAFPFPAQCTVFHWHGETFDLPRGTVRLARSRGCENQAFQLNRQVIGLQFHLEMMPDGVRSIVESCRHELVPGSYIQSAREILHPSATQYRAINQLMSDVLEYLVDPRAHTAPNHESKPGLSEKESHAEG
jgi:GMP synthase-like glutamine amidotransferase